MQHAHTCFRSRFFAIAVALTLMTPSLMHAQGYVQLQSISRQGFPNITAKFSAFNRDGNQIVSLNPSDILLTENGIPRNVTLLSCPSTDTIPTTMGIMVDSYRHLPLASDGIRYLANLMRMPPSSVGITTMDRGVFILQDLTMDRKAVLDASNRVISTPSVHLHRIFYDDNAGGVRFVSRRNGRKVLVLITDLHCPVFDLDTARLWKDAARENIRVYSILINASDYGDLFARVGIKTGGKVYENVTSYAQVKDIMTDIAVQLGSEPCTISWQSGPDCDTSRLVELSIPSYGLRTTARYTAPAASSIPTLVASTQGVAFYNATIGVDHDTLVTVTAKNRAITIRSLNSSSPLYSITCTDRTLPTIIEIGETATFRIRFHPVSAEYSFGLLDIESDACTGNTIFVTGIYEFSAHKPSLKIEYPNGGERLIGGDTTVIQWSGVFPSDTIEIEYSSDDGSSWNPITKRATGLRYNWRVPLTASDRCQLRAYQRFQHPNSPNIFSFQAGTSMSSARFSPDASTILTCQETNSLIPNGRVQLWDAYSGTYIIWIHILGRGRHAIYNTDGKTMFCSTADSTVELVGIQLSTVLRIYRGHTAIIQDMRLSPDGKRLATFGDDGRVIIFDVATAQVLTTFRPHTRYATAIRYSPDGTLIATSGGDTTIVISEAVSGKPILSIRQPSICNSIDFNASGTLLAVGCNDQQIRIFSVSDGALVKTITGHTKGINSVEFNPVGDLLLSTSADNTARIWNTATGLEAKPKFKHSQSISEGHFDPTGTRTIVATVDGLIRVQKIADAPVYQSDTSNALWSILVPQLEVTTTRVDMGMAYVFSMKDSLVETVVCNRGEAPVHILGVEPTSGNVSDFMITSGAGDFILPPGECRAMVFTFTPTVTGPRQARFTLRTTLDSLRDTILVTGSCEVTRLSIFSSAIDFGLLNVGSTKDTTIDIMVRNTGTLPFVISEVSIGGPDTTQFAIVSGGGGRTLAPNERQAMRLRFSPMIVGKTSARVDVYYDGPGSPVNIPLFAEAVGPRLLPTATPLECIIPCRAFVDTTLNIYNNGNAPLLITSLDLAGNDPDLFFITPDPRGISQVTIAPGSHLPLQVRYHPPSPGHHAATLTFVSNAIDAPGGITIIPLIGEKDSTGFTLSRTTVAFTDIPKLTPERTSLTLTNTGTLPLVWTAPVNLGPFTIESITPSTTLPGETSEIVVTFAGAQEGYSFNTTYLFDAGVCGRPTPLTLSVKVHADPAVILATPDITASPGDTIEIPIQMINPEFVSYSGATAFTATLTCNSSLLMPVGTTPSGSVVGGRRIIPLTLPIPPSTSPSTDLIRLRFLVALGDDSTTTLALERYAAIGGAVALTSTDGRFTLSGLCTSNGARLVRLSDDLLLRPLRPTPVHAVAEVDFTLTEDGPTRLSIVNSAGEVVQVLSDQEYSAGAHSLTLNAAALPSGFYICVLQTRSRRVMRPFVVE